MDNDDVSISSCECDKPSERPELDRILVYCGITLMTHRRISRTK